MATGWCIALALVALSLRHVAASGLFTAVLNTDYAGSNIAVLTGVSPSACLAKCAANPACVMYTTGYFFFINKCWLKSAALGASSFYFGMTSFIPTPPTFASCSVDFDSCDGSFSPGGTCPGSSPQCPGGVDASLNAASRAVTLFTAASVVNGLPGLSAMHLPSVLHTLNVRSLISTAIAAVAVTPTCGTQSFQLYSGSSFAALATCTHPALSDSRFYFPLAGAFSGYAGCVALDPCSTQIQISATSGSFNLFKSAVTGVKAAELPTSVSASLAAATLSLSGEAPMRDAATTLVTGTAQGHISLIGAVSLAIHVPAAALLASGTVSMVVDYDPTHDGVGSVDHAITMSLSGGPTISYGPSSIMETLDFTTVSGLNTDVSWTFLGVNNYVLKAGLDGGLTLSDVMAQSYIISTALTGLVSGALTAPVALTFKVSPTVWSVGIQVSGGVSIVVNPLQSTVLTPLGSSNPITIAGTFASTTASVSVLLGIPVQIKTITL